MPKFFPTTDWRGLVLAVTLALGAAVPVGMRAQDTIKVGPLKPLETLPSLGGTGAVPKPSGDLGLSSAPVMPPPAATVPALAPVPVPAAAPAPQAAPSTEAQAPAAPPPLPTNSTVTISGPIAQAYLYIEPFQTRFEVIFDAATVMDWLTPGVALPEALAPDQQKQLADTMVARASAWCSMSAGDQPLPVPQPLASVIKGLPGNTLPMKEGDSVAMNQALVGLMWEFATPPGPEELNVTWKGWIKGTTKLPLRVFFGSQSESGELLAALKSYRWRNQGRMPRPAPLAAVPQILLQEPLLVPAGGIFWFLAGLLFYIFLKVKDRKLPGGSLPYVFVWLLGAVLMSQMLVIPIQTGSGSAPAITEVSEAQKIVSPLLRNVYRAFDHHAESEVYDVLARSVDGELLRRLYLETIQALTLDGREGTRVTIAEFSATVDKVLPNPKGPGFMADCNWMARGIVGHWGHSHPRVNIYNARITVTPMKEEWKLTGLEVQEVRRL